MSWIKTVPWAASDGQLKAAYDWQASRLGQPAEFTMLGSLYPAIVEERLRLYRAVEGCPSGLDETERQFAAYVTSLNNGTGHCASGLRLKLESLGVSADQLSAVEDDPANPATGDDRLDLICAHAAKLTTRPTEMTEDDIDVLRQAGLSDLDLLDLNNMVGYYNYINRVVNGLGLRSVMSDLHEATRAVPGEAGQPAS
ncbi:MAG: hypothetical protein OEU32_14450 [Acidimicrobiia bacterium]|nr:hypothetical protein [Acidimicrobiia bacterium]